MAPGENKPLQSVVGAPEPSPALIIAGPTGIGKTEVAVEIAANGPIELVSADSMQVYRRMKIGTAQPKVGELRGVRIHGCAFVNPIETFDAKKFLDACDIAHADIVGRAKEPLYVGGTGMYLRALRWGLFDMPKSDPALKTYLRIEAEKLGTEAMHRRLQERDPETAARIPPADTQRIVRALEVLETTGKSLASVQRQWTKRKARFPHRLVVLSCPREVLIERIEKRVAAMLENGWIEEVQALLEAGLSPNEQHCFKALGYREIASYLTKEISREEMETKIRARTRQFSKRQLTWFRKEHDATWIEFDGVDAACAVRKIQNFLESAEETS